MTHHPHLHYIVPGGGLSVAFIRMDVSSTAPNRGHDTLVVCALDNANGLLEVREHVPTGGGHPRNFCFDPSGRWLLVANRDEDNVVVFRPNETPGTPVAHAQFQVPAPVCLLFAGSPA